MHILDAPWIGKAVAVLILVAIFAVLWLSHRLEKRGILKNYSRGLGRGLLQLNTILRPSTEHVQQAKEERERVEKDDSGPGPR
jgi:hypothetical protein